MFVDFSQTRTLIAPQQPKTPPNAGTAQSHDRATTLALGEEGGTQPPPIDATTLALGEEGGTRPPIDATTLALGEEGGTRPPIDVTTLALGEEGGIQPPPIDISTKALGEEGGITSYVTGEEGGGIPPYPQPNPDPRPKQAIAVKDARTVLKEADTGRGGIGGDGQLTRQELSTYVNYLQNIRFIQAPGPEFTNKLGAAQFMLKNFDALAKSGGYWDDTSTISHRDIQQAAPKDGNASDISTRDLNNAPVVTRAWWENGGGSYPPMPLPLPPAPPSMIWQEGGYPPVFYAQNAMLDNPQ